MSVLRWLGLDDWKAVTVIVCSIVFLVLMLGVLPSWLRHQSRSEYQGAPIETAKGVVSLVTISPVSQGGGGLFNAIAVKFAGYQEYYALPLKSMWKPDFGQLVLVRYQKGRGSKEIRIVSVTPTSPS